MKLQKPYSKEYKFETDDLGSSGFYIGISDEVGGSYTQENGWCLEDSEVEQLRNELNAYLAKRRMRG